MAVPLATRGPAGGKEFDYPYYVAPQEQERADATGRNVVVGGIVHDVMRGVTEGGISLHVQRGEGVPGNDDGDAEVLPNASRALRAGASMHVSMLERLTRDAMTRGYGILVVTADPARPGRNHVVVPDDGECQLRWRVVPGRFEREYAVFATPRRRARGAAAKDFALTRVRNAYPLVVYPPVAAGAAGYVPSSPVYRCARQAAQLDAVLAYQMDALERAAHVPLIVRHEPTQAPRAATEYPFILGAVDPDGAMRPAPVSIDVDGPFARSLAAASADAARANGARWGGTGSGGAAAGAAAPATGTQEEDLIPGYPTARLEPGLQLAAPTRPVLDTSGAVALVQELTTQIGRAIGVGVESLYGSGSSNVVAAVKAAQHHRAELAASLQAHLVEFLERVFTVAHAPELAAVLLGEEERAGARARAGAEDDPASAILLKVTFNNSPFLFAESAEKLFMTGTITEDAFKRLMLRVNRLPATMMRPAGEAPTPTDLLLQPQLVPAPAPPPGGGGGAGASPPRPRPRARSRSREREGRRVPRGPKDDGDDGE